MPYRKTPIRFDTCPIFVRFIQIQTKRTHARSNSNNNTQHSRHQPSQPTNKTGQKKNHLPIAIRSRRAPPHHMNGSHFPDSNCAKSPEQVIAVRRLSIPDFGKLLCFQSAVVHPLRNTRPLPSGCPPSATSSSRTSMASSPIWMSLTPHTGLDIANLAPAVGTGTPTGEANIGTLSGRRRSGGSVVASLIGSRTVVGLVQRR